MSLIKAVLALSLRAGAHQFGFYSILAGLRCRDLSFSLIDSREGPFNASVLQLALAEVVVDSSSGRLYGRARLGHLRLIIVVLQLDEQISFVHRLIIGNGYASDDPGYLRTEWREIAANVGIVGNLFRVAPFPGIPFSGNSDQDGQSE